MSSPTMRKPTIYYDAFPALTEACPGKGVLEPTFALVGMAPSPKRPADRRNEPFGASSYRALQRILEHFRVGDDLYITNLVKTPVEPGTRLSTRLAAEYYPTLIEELKTIGVQKRVLILGADVAQCLCPSFTDLREDHGNFFQNPDLPGLWLIPTYHFSAVARNPQLLATLQRDFERFFHQENPEEPAVRILEDYDDFPIRPRGTRLFLDLETEDLSLGCRIKQAGLKWENDEDVYIMDSPEPTQLVDWLRSLHPTLVCHNVQFDLTRLLYFDSRPWPGKVDDTLILAHMAGEEALSLKHLTSKFTTRPGSRAFGGTDDHGYLTEDVLSTEALFHLPGFLDAREAYIYQVVRELLPEFCLMQVNGVHIDRSKLIEMGGIYDQRISELSTELGPGVNWNSPKQVATFLLDSGVKLRDKTPTGAYSVSEAVLQSFAGNPTVSRLLELREFTKARSFITSYGTLVDSLGYLHPSLRLHGTDTGRLSCREPNLQQVPRTGPIKTLFASRWPEGRIGLCDLSQAELRVAALLADDRELAEALMSEDVHRFIASRVYRKPPEDITSIERKKSKGITFGLLYGGSPSGLSTRVGVPTTEVVAVLEQFFQTFPGLSRWLERTGQQGVDQGEVRTLFGRRRSLRNLLALEGENGAKRKAVNTPIQSVASDLMLMLLNYVTKTLRARNLHSIPLFTVHDSMLLDIYPGEERKVIRVLEEAFWNLNKVEPLRKLNLWGILPILGDYAIGGSWAAVESTNELYTPDHKGTLTTEL